MAFSRSLAQPPEEERRTDNIDSTTKIGSQARLARIWRTEALDYIMKARIILHNMIIEDECDANAAEDLDFEQAPESINTTVSHEPIEELSQLTSFIAAHQKIKNKDILNSNRN
ncbi:hypothetical protein SO802_031913 [Lithocarpus litseifolius]|uniref:Uncharacterized protein n=1 Tax=Lithocarpus litseifolius TaxID=425828 RepID=A0AAW2BP47_9ROSI